MPKLPTLFNQTTVFRKINHSYWKNFHNNLIIFFNFHQITKKQTISKCNQTMKRKKVTLETEFSQPATAKIQVNLERWLMAQA